MISISKTILVLVALVVNICPVHAFQPAALLYHRQQQQQQQQHHRRHSLLRVIKANGDSSDVDEANEDKNDNLLGRPIAASRLSHAMLQVPSVDTTLQFWKETSNAQVTASSQIDSNDNGDDKLKSAFCVLGNGKSIDKCFALELVRNKHKEFVLGNAISYLGISKLIQFASPEDLISVITGSKPDPPEQEEPNGLRTELVASAPGDYFARFCLHTSALDKTTDFYTNILGMDVAAVGDNGEMLCLRYPSALLTDMTDDSSVYGVPTTLVFEPLPRGSTLSMGNCFDHLVIATEADIDAVYEQVQELLEESDLECPIFMKPTKMFGQKVIGVMDPNGYKIILAGKA